MNPPDRCCQDEANRRPLKKFRGGLAYECAVCSRRYLSAEFFMDEACIHPISLRLWKEIEEGQADALDSDDLARTIMNRKPYYALDLNTGQLNPVH